MKLLSSLIIASLAFLYLTGDADGQRKQSVSLIKFCYDDVAFNYQVKNEFLTTEWLHHTEREGATASRLECKKIGAQNEWS